MTKGDKKNINRNGMIWTQSTEKEVRNKRNMNEGHEKNLKERRKILYYTALRLSSSAIPPHPPLFSLARQNCVFGENLRRQFKLLLFHLWDWMAKGEGLMLKAVGSAVGRGCSLCQSDGTGLRIGVK